MGNSASVSKMPLTSGNDIKVSLQDHNYKLSSLPSPGLRDIEISAFSAVSISDTKKELEEYPELQDVLDHVKAIVKSVLKHKDTDAAKKTMNLSVKYSLDELYGYYFEIKISLHRQFLGDTLANSGASPGFLEYWKILTNNGNEYPMEGYKHECFEVLLGVMWNFSDTSLQLCDEFGRVGILHKMLHGLKKFQNTFKSSSAQNFIVLSAMSVFHNCAKSSNNMKYYKSMDAVETVAWYAKKTDLKEVLEPLSIMTLAYIVDEKNNDIILADDSIIKTILKLLHASLQAADHRCDGFSAEELIGGLTRLASNADNSIIIVENGVLKSILLMLQQGSKTEKITAANAVWVLAFTEKNKETINSQHQELIEILKKHASTHSSLKLKNSASGALWVLKLEENSPQMLPETEKERSKPAKKRTTKNDLELNNKQSSSQSNVHTIDVVKDTIKPSHVMMSYQWDCQKTILKVKHELDTNGYRVWIDLEEMGGSTLQSMAEAVEMSSVVLIAVSQKYKDSPNCRTEAEYAYKLSKPIIPLLIEKDFKPDGWLGAIIGAKFYHNFANLEDFEETSSRLLKELSQNEIQKYADTVVQALPVSSPMTSKPLKEWTQNDVMEWAKESNISKLNFRELDGSVLLFLRKLKHEAPEFFYRCLSEQLGLKNLRSIMSFVNALQDIA